MIHQSIIWRGIGKGGLCWIGTQINTLTPITLSKSVTPCLLNSSEIRKSMTRSMARSYVGLASKTSQSLHNWRRLLLQKKTLWTHNAVLQKPLPPLSIATVWWLHVHTGITCASIVLQRLLAAVPDACCSSLALCLLYRGSSRGESSSRDRWEESGAHGRRTFTGWGRWAQG